MEWEANKLSKKKKKWNNSQPGIHSGVPYREGENKQTSSGVPLLLTLNILFKAKY